MPRRCLLLAMCSCAILVSSFTWTSYATEKTPMLRHLVLYKFKDDASADAIQEVIDTFAALPQQIDTIAGFEHGRNVSPEGKSEGLTYGFLVSFRSESDRDAYLTHPAHLDYVKVVKDRRERVVVFDYWTTE